MKLSFIFELLLIFILIAFAASAVIDSRGLHNSKRALNRKHGKVGHKRQQESPNKYCSCSTQICNCCREFNVPVVSLQGPGCASLQYLKGDRLAISMSFGERVLTNTTISSKKPQPVCMPLPGGVSKFCGRVYNIARKGDDFNACLGLELRSLKEIEATLKVSCFRFGPKGLRVEPAQPLPVVEEEDDDDDDDDDDEDDEYDYDDEEDDDDDNDVDSVDYGTFSVFDDDFIGEYFSGGSSGGNRKKKPVVQTTRAPLRRKVTSAGIRRKPVQIIKPNPVKAVTKRIPTTTTTATTTTTTTSTTTTPRPTTTATTTTTTTTIPAKAQVSEETSIANEVTETTTSISTTEQTTPLEKHETTTLLVESTTTNPETTTTVSVEESDEDSDEDDVDPISEVVGEVIEEEVESEESTTKQLPNDKDIVDMQKDDKEKKDVIEDIVDGMVDTFVEEDSSESKNRTAIASDDDDDEDEDEEDDDEDEEDDDDEARKFSRNRKGRQSKDMWLDRLHW